MMTADRWIQDLSEGYLHKSHMFAYLTCPRYFKYRYVLGLPEGEEASLVARLGRDFHEWAKAFFEAVDCRRLSELKAYEVYGYLKQFLPQNPTLRVHAQFFVEHETKRWIELMDCNLWKPVATEIYLRSDTWRIAGTIDRIERLPSGEYAIVEYKTTRSSNWTKMRKELAFYVFLVRDSGFLPPDKVTTIGWINTHVREVHYEPLKPATIRGLVRSLQKVREGIQKGIYDPKPNGCMFCPYYDLCMEEGLPAPRSDESLKVD